jgi:hypothetical protein
MLTRCFSCSVIGTTTTQTINGAQAAKKRVSIFFRSSHVALAVEYELSLVPTTAATPTPDRQAWTGYMEAPY